MIATVEEQSVADVYRECATDLVRYATVLVGPADAQDVVSDAVGNALASKHWSSVRDGRAYLFRSVLNTAVSHKRSSGRRVAREERAARGERPAGDADLAASIDAHRALASLTPNQRAVVYLTYWDDLTPAQIASLLDVSEGTVKKQLARAREQLRRILDA